MSQRVFVNVCAVAVLGGTLAVGCGSKDADQQAASTPTTTTTEQVSQRDEQLNSRPPFDAALTEYKTAVRDMADYIGALNHGTAWAFSSRGWVACGGEYAETDARQVHLTAGFSGPISDASWPAALQLVKDVGARFGATEFGVRRDEPGNHDAYVTGRDGIQFELSSQTPSALTATSDCRLSAAAPG